MTNNRQPFIGSGRTLEGGALATRKQDFNAHVEGTGFIHTADIIAMNPPIPTLGGTTVQQSIQNVTSLITSSGTGFISIGNAGVDGYALGAYNINTVATPTLKDAFNAAVADRRLTSGGVILLLAGTYVTTAPIEIPPGITVMGELAGTLIIGEMSEQSMFIIDPAVKNININGNSGSGTIPLNTGSGTEKTRFVNLMLADNLNGNVASGGTSMVTVPMVSLKVSANFECQNVSFIGRLNNGSIVNRPKTLAAIGTVIGGSNGTALNIDNCFFDGLKLAINFNSMLGDIDYLTVTNSKARTYGTEGTASIPLNSFIFASLCNLHISGNYYIGAGTITNTFLNLGTTGSSVTNLKIAITNNSGSPSTTSLSSLVQNDSGVSFGGLVTSNNWGNDINSPWFIVAGGSSGTDPLGDILGPGAIDIIFKMANAGSQATIMVNSGTYNVSGQASSANNFSNLKFIGNKNGKNYPIFNLNLTSVTTDNLGNKFLVFGNYIKSIQFTSTGSTHSVVPTFNATSNTTQNPANSLLVEDCLFTNTSLYFMDIGVGPFNDALGQPAKLHITVDSCDFKQTGTYNDSISLVSPRANTVIVSNCNFTGYGYALSIGTNTYTSANIQDASYLVENTTFDLTSFTIDDAPPGVISANYISITDILARVVFENCQILSNSAFGNVASVNITLTNAGTFTKFVYIGSKEFEMLNCVVGGTTQTFTVAAVAYVLPSLFVEVSSSSSIINTRFIGGTLPLQFGGPNFTKTGGVVVQGCEFLGNSAPGQFTQLDLDFNLTAFGGTKPFIRIIDNIFEALSVSDVQVRHTNATGAFYNAHGVVQVYANNYDIVFANNKVGTTLRVPAVNPYSHFSGVVIDNYDSTSNSGNLINSVTVHDNNVTMVNAYTSVTATQSATALWIKSSDAKVHDNYLAVNNTAGSPTNFVGCMYIDARPTITAPFYSDAIVTGNSFVRRAPSGATGGNFVGGFVIIPSTSGRGTLVNNSFSDPTIDGSAEIVVLDQTSQPNKWLITQNKNQTEAFNIRGNIGRLANSSHVVFSLEVPTVLGVYNTNPIVEFWDVAPPSYTFDIQYASAGSATFVWNIPLFDLLPKNVRIISVRVSGQSDHVMTSCTFLFSLNGATPVALSGSPVFKFESPYIANSILTSVITSGNTSSADTYVNTASESLTIFLEAFIIQNAASASIKVNPIIVKYRW